MTSFLFEVNQYIGQFLSCNVWSTIEMISALYTFYMSLWLRVNIESFKSGSQEGGWIGTKIGQIGLYIQTVIALIVFVDGFQTLGTSNPPHIILILCMIATSMVKYNVFNVRSKIKN